MVRVCSRPPAASIARNVPFVLPRCIRDVRADLAKFLLSVAAVVLWLVAGPVVWLLTAPDHAELGSHPSPLSRTLVLVLPVVGCATWLLSRRFEGAGRRWWLAATIAVAVVWVVAALTL
jgi:hypothetical protein